MKTLIVLFLAPLLLSGAASFEVASVKIGVQPERVPMFCIVPCTNGERLDVIGSRVDIRYMSLQQLIVRAYGIKPFQLSGPEWMRTQRFDIAAKMPQGVTKDKIPEMLQALLAERFKLAMHRESKEQPVYALVVGKNGAKLTQAAADVAPAVPESARANPLYTPQGDGYILDGGGFVVTDGAYGPIRGGRGANGGMKMEFLKISMPALAEVITPHVDRPVVDMTDLKGSYYFMTLNDPPAGGGRGRKGDADAPVDSTVSTDPMKDALFAALDKAGLKVESRKAPVELIVVDHLEKIPTGN
jgi:uncharacterized protein (TIGR03435 family)